MLDEVQQFDGVGHPQEQRLQTWDQLLHAEHLETLGLLGVGAANVETQRKKHRGQCRNKSAKVIAYTAKIIGIFRQSL